MRPALSPRQESIAGRLRAMIGEGPAAFFVDACRLVSGDPPIGTVTHVVAHLLREVESALRYVLQPTARPGARPGGDKHRASILAVLDELGISHDEPTAEFWLGMTGEGNPNGLAMRAHRAALEAPRPMDGAFTDLVDGFEETAGPVAAAFRSQIRKRVRPAG